MPITFNLNIVAPLKLLVKWQYGVNRVLTRCEAYDSMDTMPTKPIIANTVYNVQEAAELLSISHETLLDYIRSGKIVAQKIGEWKILGQALINYLITPASPREQIIRNHVASPDELFLADGTPAIKPKDEKVMYVNGEKMEIEFVEDDLVQPISRDDEKF